MQVFGGALHVFYEGLHVFQGALHILPFTGNFLKTHTKKPPSAQEGGLHCILESTPYIFSNFNDVFDFIPLVLFG